MEKHSHKSDENSEERKPTIKVKVLDIANGTALIEWIKDSVIFRAYLPAKKLAGDAGDEVGEDELKKSVPYGDNLKAQFAPIDPAVLERELNKRGIWTIADVEQNVSMVHGLIMRLSQYHVTEYLRKLRGE